MGGTFAARRVHEGTEALRSRDNWFRPVFLADGPDGALYIADMYRKTIEHPEYLPGEVRKHTDFEAGKDKGRIWRLAATSNAQRSTFKAMGIKLPALVAELSSPIPWRRDTAFRLLVERNDAATAALVRKSIHESDVSGPAVAKLRLLELAGGVDEPILSRALKHSQPAVRQNAVRIAESRLATNPALRDIVLKLAHDPDPQVRFQVALSLGETSDPRVVPALARIAAQQASDRWTRAAIRRYPHAHRSRIVSRIEPGRKRRRLEDGLEDLQSDLAEVDRRSRRCGP